MLCNEDPKYVMIQLIMAYYAWDLTYPVQYQLLGLIQKYCVKDAENGFKKSTNWVKFDQEMLEVIGVN